VHDVNFKNMGSSPQFRPEFQSVDYKEEDADEKPRPAERNESNSPRPSHR
jgi:hypothetical protein